MSAEGVAVLAWWMRPGSARWGIRGRENSVPTQRCPARAGPPPPSSYRARPATTLSTSVVRATFIRLILSLRGPSQNTGAIHLLARAVTQTAALSKITVVPLMRVERSIPLVYEAATDGLKSAFRCELRVAS
jgi:hypothetical protein